MPDYTPEACKAHLHLEALLEIIVDPVFAPLYTRGVAVVGIVGEEGGAQAVPVQVVLGKELFLKCAELGG